MAEVAVQALQRGVAPPLIDATLAIADFARDYADRFR